MDEIIAQKYEAVRTVLNEQSRRRWAAAEALALGWGGISTVARATGLSRPTIRAGIREIQQGETVKHLCERRSSGQTTGRWAKTTHLP